MMKKTLNLLMVLLVIGLSSFAQDLSKAEKKILVAKAKQFKKNPAQLNQLLNDFEASKAKVNQSEKASRVLKSQLEEIQSEIAVTERKNEMLEEQVASLISENKTLSKEQSTGVSQQKGVVFRVQIGGFKKRNLLEYNEADNLIRVETNANGIQEISLGVFRSYKKADVFKKHLREMGLKDAWIVPYKDGKQVALKEVYQEAISN